MRKLLIATAAAAGLMALGACQPTTTEDETDMAEAADEAGTDAATGGSDGSDSASAAGDSGTDASAPGGAGGSASGGDSATPAQPMSPSGGSTDPMVTGQGSTSGEGQIQMGSEPPHPARQ